MSNYCDEIFNALGEIDNKAFEAGNCSLVFYFGINDDGERYVDAELLTGFITDRYPEDHEDLGGYIGGEDLNEAIKELAKVI